MTRKLGFGVAQVCILLVGSSVSALTTGTDVVVPAAGRGPGVGTSMWITDLSVLNTGTQTGTVEIFWLARNQANSSPPSASYSLPPGSALILEDVISDVFGLDAAGGAFRVVADVKVAVASRIYNLQDTVTFGQGFEGIPRLEAIAEGQSTDVAGLREDARFRTNLVLIDASDTAAGSSVELSLLSETGVEIASATENLRRLEPKLFPVTNIAPTSFDYATLHVEVTSGAVIVAASKVDNDPSTGDPTTLEAWTQGPDVDGTYHFAIYDSMLFAAGGDLVVGDGLVTTVTGTYFNWDKTDGAEPECTLLFAWGGALSPPVPLADFASGVDFETVYPDGAVMTYTVRFELDSSTSFVGSVSAIGNSFVGIDAGCNGAFPELEFEGGKVE